MAETDGATGPTTEADAPPGETLGSPVGAEVAGAGGGPGAGGVTSAGGMTAGGGTAGGSGGITGAGGVTSEPDAPAAGGTSTSQGGSAGGIDGRAADANAGGASGDARGSAGGAAGAGVSTVCPPAPSCPANQNVCADKCVSSVDPKYGCGATTCSACAATFAHAQTVCSEGQCAMGACHPGWEDCNHDASDGCEVDITTPMNCGGCAMACGGQKCSAGICVDQCVPPLTDCNGTCADLLTSAQHCGRCASGECSAKPGTIPSCVSGTCQPTCASGLTLCNGVCVDTGMDPNNCGGCGIACPMTGQGYATCGGGTCAPCDTGFESCGGSCLDLKWSREHCGLCSCPGGNTCCIGGCFVNTTCDDALFCQRGTCQDQNTFVLASDSLSDKALAVDDQFLYWVDSDAGALKRARKSDAVVETLATGQAKPWRLAVDAQSVYWTNNLGGAVMAMPKSGGSPAVLAAAVQPWAIAQDTAFVYWTNQGDGTLRSVPKAGGASIVIATITGMMGSVALDGDEIYFSGQDISPPVKGRIYKVAKSGGAVETVVETGYQPSSNVIPSMLVTDSDLFWTESDGSSFGKVFRMPKAGGIPASEFVSTDGVRDGVTIGKPLMDTIAVADCYFYWSQHVSAFPGGLQRKPLNGKWPTEVGIGPLSNLVVDPSYVYGVRAGTIYRFPR